MTYSTRDPESVRLLTQARMTLDRLVMPTWPALGAVVDRRLVFKDGLQYQFYLPGWRLRLELRLLDAVARPTLSVRLSGRSDKTIGKVAAWLRLPADDGFDDLGMTALVAGDPASVAAMLEDMRLVAWRHPRIGVEATRFWPIA